MFYAEFVCVIMLYLHTKFHDTSSNLSFNTTIKLEIKYKFCVDTMALFHAEFYPPWDKKGYKKNTFWSSFTTKKFSAAMIL